MLFSEKFLTYALPAGLFSSLIKVLSVSEHSFFILKFYCFMLLLNFISSKYSFFRRISYIDMVSIFRDMSSKCLLFMLATSSYLFSVLLSFFSISNNNIFFLKFVIYLVISEMKLSFQCCKPEVVGLLSTKWL